MSKELEPGHPLLNRENIALLVGMSVEDVGKAMDAQARAGETPRTVELPKAWQARARERIATCINETGDSSWQGILRYLAERDGGGQ